MDDYLDCTLRDLGPEAIAKLERYAVGRGIPVDRAARDMIVQYGVIWENHVSKGDTVIAQSAATGEIYEFSPKLK